MHRGLQRGRFPTRRSSLRAAAVALAVGTVASSVVIGGIAAGVSNHKAKHVVVSTRTTKYGTILVSGKTLYVIKSASKFPCTGNCLKIWPELQLPKGVTAATAGSGVNASSLGTVMRRNGSRQVTYAGKPLYWFYKDTAPGQVNGNISDKWGTWSVVVMVNAAGAAPITGSTLPPGSTTTSTPHSTPSTMNPNNSSNTNTPPPAPPVTTPPTAPPVTTPPTTPPTSPPTTPPTSPPTTTTTSAGGGGVGF